MAQDSSDRPALIPFSRDLPCITYPEYAPQVSEVSVVSLEADQWVVDSELGSSPYKSFVAYSIASAQCPHLHSKGAAPVEAEAAISHLYLTWR